MKKLFALLVALLMLLSCTSCAVLEDFLNYYLQDDVDEDVSAFAYGKLMIEVTDVGQGDSILLISPEGKTMLIDTGEMDAYASVCKALDDHGVNKIDWLVATHPHSDHIGCMYKIVDKFDIGEVYMPDKSHTSKTYEKLLKSIDKKKLTIKTAESGVKIDMGSGVLCEMFSPNPDKEYSDLNDYSPIMRFTYGSTAFVTTGDAGFENEADALSYSDDISASVIKLGHHGSSTSSSEEFIRAVDPDYAIISVGTDNSYGHPHKETMELMSKLKIKVLQTNELGDIYVYSDGSQLSIGEQQDEAS